MSTDDAIASLRAYVYEGRPTGGFLEAVLCNDLMKAVGYADESSMSNLQDICRYVYYDMPAGCWGSAAKVADWHRNHAEAREARSA